ncbi:MAG: hypothetical protein JW800_01695 [Candidatus Omnitrophica bacterium]|nr:hypothetical protein [Candidatus Omnitrophota bacterium]
MNPVWGMDITYAWLGNGFAYLVAVMAWYSRDVLAWRLSDMLTTDFCVNCFNDALQYDMPKVFNADQGF